MPHEQFSVSANEGLRESRALRIGPISYKRMIKFTTRRVDERSWSGLGRVTLLLGPPQVRNTVSETGRDR